MMIETERLQLIPLTPDQLRLWVTDMAELESELGVVYDAEPMEGIFLKIVEGQCGITEKDEAHYVYHTFWFLVRREDRVVVGSADFKNVPDPEGLVEIGYGLGLKYEHKGYMTAVSYTQLGAILSSGLILPLNICVGLVVACTMYAFYTLFRKGGM